MAGPTDPRVTVLDPLTGETSTVYVGPTGYVVVCGADRHVASTTPEGDDGRIVLILERGPRPDPAQRQEGGPADAR